MNGEPNEGGDLETALATFLQVDRMPAMSPDGGGVRVVSVDEATGVAELVLLGTCRHCPSNCRSAQTVRERVLAAFPQLVEVEIPTKY